MNPKLLNLHDNPYSVLKAMKNEEEQNVETKRIDGREDEEEEEKRIDTFFKLIKSYQEARKRRREELAENSGDVRKKTNVGETSGTVVVPAFQPEDFSQRSTDVKPLVAVSDHKEEDVKVKEEEEEEAKKEEEDKGLDLNLAL